MEYFISKDTCSTCNQQQKITYCQDFANSKFMLQANFDTDSSLNYIKILHSFIKTKDPSFSPSQSCIFPIIAAKQCNAQAYDKICQTIKNTIFMPIYFRLSEPFISQNFIFVKLKFNTQFLTFLAQLDITEQKVFDNICIGYTTLTTLPPFNLNILSHLAVQKLYLTVIKDNANYTQNILLDNKRTKFNLLYDFDNIPLCN